MFERVLNTPLDDTSRLDRSSKCKLLRKPSVFIVLPIIRNLKQFQALFLIHSLTTFLDSKLKFNGGFFELEMLEIFTRTSLLKMNLKLSIMDLSSHELLS